MAAGEPPRRVALGNRLDGLYLAIRETGVPGPVWFVPHDNEKVGVRALEGFWRERPVGTLIELSQTGRRYIRQTVMGRSVWADPNRIFSPDPPVILRELRKVPRSECGGMLDGPARALPAAVPDFQTIATEILAVLRQYLDGSAEPLLVALHNNTNGGFGIGGQDYARVYRQTGQDSDDFFLVTIADDFERLKASGWNVALQKTNTYDDGSLSIWAKRHGVRYINIEAEQRRCQPVGQTTGHLDTQQRMIATVVALISVAERAP